jgi:hypothetical protein
MMGDTVRAEGAELEVTVRGGVGQVLRVLRDGEVVETVALDADEVTWRTPIAPHPGSGPLGTAWEVQTADDLSLTTIANPVFLRSGT